MLGKIDDVRETTNVMIWLSVPGLGLKWVPRLGSLQKEQGDGNQALLPLSTPS